MIHFGYLQAKNVFVSAFPHQSFTFTLYNSGTEQDTLIWFSKHLTHIFAPLFLRERSGGEGPRILYLGQSSFDNTALPPLLPISAPTSLHDTHLLCFFSHCEYRADCGMCYNVGYEYKKKRKDNFA